MYNQNKIRAHKLVNYHSLQQNIGIAFGDMSLLQQAFYHSSFVNENPDLSIPNNERLEFLGDAVLNFIVAEKMYHEFPNMTEGELTVDRTSLIREDTLAQLASELNLGEYLKLGKGEESSGGRERRTNLADTFEALIGAIFLDQGLTITRDFVLNKLFHHIEKIRNGDLGQNYKANLQEFTQAEYKQLPAYHLVESSGPDHDKNFVVKVVLGDKVLGTGSGKSKKTAEMEAARSACKKLIPD
jgi:ribonuclease-3